MKKLFNKIVRKIQSAVTRAKAAAAITRTALASCRGEGYVDTGLLILISVVIGAVLLAGLYALFGDIILPTLTRKIQELFNYAG